MPDCLLCLGPLNNGPIGVIHFQVDEKASEHHCVPPITIDTIDAELEAVVPPQSDVPARIATKAQPAHDDSLV